MGCEADGRVPLPFDFLSASMLVSLNRCAQRNQTRQIRFLLRFQAAPVSSAASRKSPTVPTT